MKTSNGIAHDNKIGKSIVATIISLLCLSAFVVYLLGWEKLSSEEFFLLIPFLALFTFHVISLILFLKRLSAISINTSIFIGVLSLISSLLFLPMTVLIFAFHNTPVPLFINVIYLFCQIGLVYEGIVWKRRAINP